LSSDSFRQRPKIPVLLGPTASGKSALSLRLACDLELDIISCDSRQIYRGMTIGTAKPSLSDRRLVKHWLIDVADPSESFSAFRFCEEVVPLVRRLAEQGRTALVCGGTGLYYRALSRGMGPRVPSDGNIRAQLQDMADRRGSAVLHRELALVDPESAGRIHENDGPRIIRALEVFRITGVPRSVLAKRTAAPVDFEFFELVIELPRDELYRRINARADAMAAAGLWDEFRGLRRAGYDEQAPGMLCLGYRELFAVERKEKSFSAALEDIKQHTRNYAKRQMTWFRTQCPAEHIDVSDGRYDHILTKYKKFLGK
jgi:tRNA dimethylallyltransferase